MEPVQSSDGLQMKPTNLRECGADRRFSESLHGKFSASWDYGSNKIQVVLDKGIAYHYKESSVEEERTCPR
jgi:hypothetical protein